MMTTKAIYEAAHEAKESVKEIFMMLFEIAYDGSLRPYNERRWLKREEKLAKAGYYKDKDLVTTKADNF